MELDEDLNAYDPEQSLEDRRRIQRSIRDVEKDMHENIEQFLQPGSTKIINTLNKLNDNAEDIKQTNEAAIDSKALLHLSDLANRKLTRLTRGNMGDGVDPDEFLSKCISYMDQGRGITDDNNDALTHTQRHRRRPARGAVGEGDEDDDDDNESGDQKDWAHLGQYACIPSVRRPALPGFLIGPLSVQKKVRKVVIRTAPLRVKDLKEVRPEVLDTEDIAKNEKNDLTLICKNILTRLRRVQDSGKAKLTTAQQDDSIDDEELDRMVDELGMTDTGNVDLVRFCINPRSFGQTVENMFYVSFLIREGQIAVHHEENGLPSLSKLTQFFTITHYSNMSSRLHFRRR